jgi:hypothetical protein
MGAGTPCTGLPRDPGSAWGVSTTPDAAPAPPAPLPRPNPPCPVRRRKLPPTASKGGPDSVTGAGVGAAEGGAALAAAPLEQHEKRPEPED